MKTLELTDCEARLMNELLEHERQELQSEVHHTDTAALRDELQSRFHKVNRLIERLGQSEPANRPACACAKH
jgi:hypothetical protein